MRVLTEQEIERRKKLEELKQLGVEPYGRAFPVTSNAKDIKVKYADYDKEQLATINEEVVVAGRIMTKRDKGKVGFMHIQDRFGQIQIYVRADSVRELDFMLFTKADIGDIVGIKGKVFRTNTGELTIWAKEYTHLTKALRPLPEKYHGLTDIEERYRRRYVDLIMNEDARRVAFLRPQIIRSFQKYLDDLGYVEVETPILGTVLGGANARPFVTHHLTLGMDMYLRIATELHLKRLIVGGMEGVYEIGRLFRNEGIDRNHNPEFTTIELYKAYSDMKGMMELAENLIKNTIFTTLGTYQINWKGETLDFAQPWARVHMVDAIKEKCGIDFFQDYTFAEVKALGEKHNIEMEPHFDVGHIINAFFEKYVEKDLRQPTFIYGHPLAISPLAKKSKDERFTERFELFIGGDEYANAFSELNDPLDQRERFLNQLKEKKLGNEEANEMDEDYIEALEYGLPPTGGIGIGIDRLVMLITNSDNIRDVILFPQMRNKK